MDVTWALRAPSTLDELAEALRERRLRAGSPSFTVITQRVGEARDARGAHPSERSPGRVTVYDCFRAGRRRIDVDLVLDIVAALGADAAELRTWRGWCLELRRSESPVSLVAAAELSVRDADAFIGRDDLVDWLSRRTGLVAVTGMVGAGKTALARHVLSRLIESGRLNRAIEVSVRGSEPRGAAAASEAIVAAVGRVLGLNLTGGIQDAAQVAASLAAGAIGLLVDDAAVLDQVRALRRTVLTTPVLVTSRQQLGPVVEVSVDGRRRRHLAQPATGAARGIPQVALTPWNAEEALGYLRRVVGADRVDAEPEAALDLVNLSGRLPLALTLTAARASERPGWTLADHRDALRQRTEAHRLDDGVREAIELSYASLDDDERRMLRLLAVQPCTSLSVRSLAVLAELDPDAASRPVHGLLSSHCAERDGRGRLGVHALMRTFAVVQSWETDAPSQRERAIDELAEHLIGASWSAAEVLYPGQRQQSRHRGPYENLGVDEAQRWFTDEMDGLVELSDALAERRPDLVIRIAESVGKHLDRIGALPLMYRLRERAYLLAGQIGDAEGVTRNALAVGQARVRLAMPDAAAYLDEALAGSRRLGIARVEVSALNTLAVLTAQRGDYAASRPIFEEVVKLCREHHFDEMISAGIDNLGFTLTRLGDFDAAARLHREAHEIALSRGDMSWAASAISNLSEVQLLVGDAEGAVASARRAVELCRDGHHQTLAYARTNLGLALRALGYPASARREHEAALTAACEMNDPVLEASVRNDLGLALLQLDPALAREQFTKSLEVAVAHDIGFDAGRARLELATLALADGDRTSAAALLTQALAVFPDADIPERRRALELSRSLDEDTSASAP